MDGKGRALDNVVVERFWRSLKYEEVYLKEYSSMKGCREGIAAYIRKYNSFGVSGVSVFLCKWHFFIKELYPRSILQTDSRRSPNRVLA